MSEAEPSSNVTPVADGELRLSPAAEVKMAELLANAESDIAGIRVFVSGGGCGGMTYGMTYAEEVTEYDSALEGDGYKIIVDAVALNFLSGCEIDFAQDSFLFNNVFKAVGGSGMCGGCGGGAGF
ncbi:MAG: iron-sulfur cluster assembly accessory protein [Gammaproteobacteria bacterium]|jgi:iron-sulfur cluster insertion protein|nr:iron-sulfur cluster assembly accessory protein [Gammaproteobacteria bacterium]